MTVLYVCQGFRKSHALGAIIRRRGIQGGFEKLGLRPTTVSLRRRNHSISEVFSVLAPRKRDHRGFAALEKKCDGIFLEGLPVAVATIASMRRRGPSARIHIDICDSWVRLSGAGAGAGRFLRARTIRYLKRLLAGLALRYVTQYADSISYISAADLDADDRYLDPAVRRLVVANGNPVEPKDSLLAWNRNGPMVAVGDWAYPPNQAMLRTVFDWYPSIDGRVGTAGLHIIGPNLSYSVPPVESVVVLGWIDEIASAYVDVSCALALTNSGSGVKNKVLEPLSYGIPVIATREALNGISYDPSMILLFHEELSDVEVAAWLDNIRVHGRRPLNAPSWEHTVSKMASYILDGK